MVANGGPNTEVWWLLSACVEMRPETCGAWNLAGGVGAVAQRQKRARVLLRFFFVLLYWASMWAWTIGLITIYILNYKKKVTLQKFMEIGPFFENL
ncbi:hypothetical protein ES332_D13G055800v1 [Gossypium tomentosum]|uniref:Uncharacterized protein n=1 Tax=Gossypium tomentosum TaxID=34277 RepID=A0A5D2HTI8_GOSTO|nr:hypothetical protein ES332_D13G055800v1 [Gossypium tomentosum]